LFTGNTVFANAKWFTKDREQNPFSLIKVVNEELKSTSISPASNLNIFPFTAVLGQEEMKLALLLNVIDPRIGGVLALGDRGTGKSTTIRAIVDILPLLKVVEGDPFNSSPTDIDLMGADVRNAKANGEELKTQLRKVPMIELPLGATEDRVCGTIDIEKALKEGIKAFEPGLVAKANRGILYVDEVNLLDDHLIDVLLDSAASGWNIVEREGISVKHPARFIFVGSGNPEEGELRPQLLDRFGLEAEIRTTTDPEIRVRIVEERALFDSNPENFISSHSESLQQLSEKIVRAQNLLPDVEIARELRVKISTICKELSVQGLRGDMVTTRAAKALAAFDGRSEVTVEDINKVIEMCLRHRLRKLPLAKLSSGERVRAVSDQFLKPD
jgi:magnesium chelatase subunit I